MDKPQQQDCVKIEVPRVGTLEFTPEGYAGMIAIIIKRPDDLGIHATGWVKDERECNNPCRNKTIYIYDMADMGAKDFAIMNITTPYQSFEIEQWVASCLLPSRSPSPRS